MQKKAKLKIFYSLLAVVITFLIFIPRAISSFRYDSDFARDITEIQDITQGKIRLTVTSPEYNEPLAKEDLVL